MGFYTDIFTSEHCPIWNVVYQRGIHICAKRLTCWSQSRVLQNFVLSCGIICTTRIVWKLHLDTLRKRKACPKQGHLYKLVYGLSAFPSSPITFSQHASHYHTCSNHSLSLHVTFSHSIAYVYTPSSVMPLTSGTHYLILEHHHPVLTPLKGTSALRSCWVHIRQTNSVEFFVNCR